MDDFEDGNGNGIERFRGSVGQGEPVLKAKQEPTLFMVEGPPLSPNTSCAFVYFVKQLDVPGNCPAPRLRFSKSHMGPVPLGNYARLYSCRLSIKGTHSVQPPQWI